jgi:hypothetical protein
MKPSPLSATLLRSSQNASDRRRVRSFSLGRSKSAVKVKEESGSAIAGGEDDRTGLFCRLLRSGKRLNSADVEGNVGLLGVGPAEYDRYRSATMSGRTADGYKRDGESERADIAVRQKGVISRTPSMLRRALLPLLHASTSHLCSESD